MHKSETSVLFFKIMDTVFPAYTMDNVSQFHFVTKSVSNFWNFVILLPSEIYLAPLRRNIQAASKAVVLKIFIGSYTQCDCDMLRLAYKLKNWKETISQGGTMLLMSSQMLQRVLCKIAGTLASVRVPYSLAGSSALKLYGIPQFAGDLELIADKRDQDELTAALEKVNFHCCNKTESYSRFECEKDIYGRVECLFVRTRNGREMLGRRKYANGITMGSVPVVQPTDYIVLKLISMANQPGGSVEDEADIRSVLELESMDQIPAWCGPIDKERIETFAEKSGQAMVLERLFKEALAPLPSSEMFVL